jgi:hypothetical protein
LDGRLNRDELREVSPFVREKDRHLSLPLLWQVYDEYEIVDNGVEYPYLRASLPKRSRTPRQVRLYKPLTDTPYLFLDFARLAEKRDPETALEQWIGQHGLLGFHYSKESKTPMEEFSGTVVPPPLYDDRGGSGETLEAVWSEVERANEILVLYEAALNRDEDQLERLLYGENIGERRRFFRERGRETKQQRIDRLAGGALGLILEYMRVLEVFTYPSLSVAGDWIADPLLTPDRMVASWGARNLLGAMYLQFYWLITSAGDLSRCEHCGRIISHAPPVPHEGERKARKPRSDKKFCNTRCRQNYDYQNRIKPRRQQSSET